MPKSMMMLIISTGRERINQGRSLPWRQMVESMMRLISTLVMASMTLVSTGKRTMNMAIQAPREAVKPITSVRYWL